MKGVLITGVTGFVGTNLVAYLESDQGIKLFGHSRDVNQAREKYRNNQIKITPLTESVNINALQIDCLVHLAGIAHDISNRFVDQDYDEVNFGNTKRIFDEFLQSGATKFIFLSSIKAAVDTSSTPATEEVACTPVTAYGRSKRKAEEYLLSCELPNNKQIYILRPCMIHGPGNKGNLNLLYKFVKTGIPFPFGKFDNRRSFLSIDNFNFIISRIINQSIPSGVYHLADDGYLSTVELYTVITKALNRRSFILNVPTGLINSFAQLFGLTKRVDKLTESMMVSNGKIINALGQSLPMDIRSGITKTIHSFK